MKAGMGQYLPHRAKLTARQLKACRDREDAERQAAEDAAIMESLLAEQRAKQVALERAIDEDRQRRLAARPRPPKPAPLSPEEHALQKIKECIDASVERGEQLLRERLIDVLSRNIGLEGFFIEFWLARQQGRWNRKAYGRLSFWRKRVGVLHQQKVENWLADSELKIRARTRKLIHALPASNRPLFLKIIRDYRAKTREVRQQFPKYEVQE